MRATDEWSDYVDGLRERLIGSAVVSVEDGPAGSLSIAIDPNLAAALNVHWFDWGAGAEVLLSVGDGTVRWELEHSPEDLEFVTRVVDAAIAGRAVGRFAQGRHEYVLTTASGEEIKSLTVEAYRAWPLHFGWRRRAHARIYEPYGDL